MKRSTRFGLAGRAAALIAVCTTTLGFYALPASADPAPSIRFSAPVPAAPASLPLYSLKTTATPTTLINRVLLQENTPALRPETIRSSTPVHLLTAREAVTNNLRAYINPQTSESVVLPNFARRLSVVKAVHPTTIASTLFKRVDVLPHDVTTYKLASEIPILGGSVAHPAAAAGSVGTVVSAQAVRFTFVSALRYASGYPVYGIGSRATFAIGSDGSVQGLLRRWKTAARTSSVAKTASGTAVLSAIRSQLAPFAAHNAITVDQIKVVYYDGNAQYLQPAYRFTAILHPLSGRAADAHVAGFVALGQTREPVPTVLAQSSSTAPITPTQTADPQVLRQFSRRVQLLSPQKTETSLVTRKFVGEAGSTGGAAITLGEYENRDTTLNGMASQFYSGLTMHPPFFPSFGPPIVRTQYYYAFPWEVVGPDSRNFMNAVNIAYTQPHGDWYYNTTYSNYADAWDVHNIGANGNPGFGAAAGGKLATWIIDSCEVVPSMYDMSIATGNAYDAFTPWWPVFQGLHNVIGFRTEMWLYDGMNTPFGFAAQLGGDLNAAWFQEIASDPAYNDGYTYYDTHIKQNVHMGRASTFIDARDVGHSIYDVAPQSASSTLWNFWMGN